MSRNAKLGTHTGECLLCRRLGRSAPPLTLELSQSSFPAWAAAGTSAASLLPILNQRGPCGRRGPSKQSSSPFLGFALSLRIAQVCGTAPGWGKLGREEGARPGTLCFRLTFPPRRVSLPALPTGVFRDAIHPSCLRDSKLPPHSGRRASTHRIAFGAPRCCVDGAELWPGQQEPPGPPGLRS